MKQEPSLAELKELYLNLKNLDLVDQCWPKMLTQSFLGWRNERDRSDTEKLIAELDFALQFAAIPIVAVAGLINSGKSSLVASFLSNEGRARVLRGVGKYHGTQRFILWLPGAWRKDDALLGQLDTLLTRVFKSAPEPLHSAFEDAHAQQRAVEQLGIPLLAFDDALNHSGIALLDCPDIQRRQPGDEDGTNTRLQVLQSAGEICAGVILVAPRHNVEVSELQKISDHLPSASRIYAVNTLRRETPHDFLRDAPEEIANSGHPCYVSYDFDVGANSDFAPAIDPNFGAGAESASGNRLPFFFEADKDPELNARDAVGSERSLLNICARLSPEELLAKRQGEVLATLKTRLQTELARLDQEVESGRRKLEEAHAGLFEMLHRLMHEGETLRIKIDPEIAAEMVGSILRTSPWDIRLALQMKYKLRGAIRRAASGVRKAALGVFDSLGSLGERVAARKSELAYLDLDGLQQALAFWSADQGFVWEKKLWKKDADDIVDRFREEERSNLEPGEWDVLTREFWKAAPRGRARYALATAMLTTLAAAAWMAIEPLSGAAVFSTVVKGHVVVLTAGELFAVLGVGGVVATRFAADLEREIGKKLGGRQFSNLFAIACDQVGLPRNLPAGRDKDFPPAGIPGGVRPDAFGIQQPGWVSAKIRRESLELLQKLAAQI
jgi:hypothetical protein